jgi:hypothetical protein
LFGNRSDALLRIRNFYNAALLLKQRNAGGRLVPGEVFDYRQQLRVFLAHDLIELCGAHAGELQLFEWFAGVYALVLPSVPDKQDFILGRDPVKKLAHLLGARETRLVDHVEVFARWIAGGLLLSSPGEKGLQGVGRDAGLAKLARGA